MKMVNTKNNFPCAVPVNPPYQLMVIHSSKLVYPRQIYQRGIQYERVAKIAAEFNEYIANEPKVSYRDGIFYMIDGQHTTEGRILRNGGKHLPILCKVYTGLTQEQEALLFAEQTGHSAPLTAGMRLRAKVAGRYKLSIAFLDATNRMGLKIDYYQQYSDCRIGCVGTALSMYKLIGDIDVRTIFKLQGNNRDIFTRIGRDVLQIAHTVQRIFQRTGDVGLDILGTRARIGGHHHDGVGLNLRVKVD